MQQVAAIEAIAYRIGHVAVHPLRVHALPVCGSLPALPSELSARVTQYWVTRAVAFAHFFSIGQVFMPSMG